MFGPVKEDWNHRDVVQALEKKPLGRFLAVNEELKSFITNVNMYRDLLTLS